MSIGVHIGLGNVTTYTINFIAYKEELRSVINKMQNVFLCCFFYCETNVAFYHVVNIHSQCIMQLVRLIFVLGLNNK